MAKKSVLCLCVCVFNTNDTELNIVVSIAIFLFISEYLCFFFVTRISFKMGTFYSHSKTEKTAFVSFKPAKGFT